MNLTTNYLGLRLCTPFVVGSSPFCDHLPAVRRLQAAGASAVVMRSLFEEQIEPPSRRSSAPGPDGLDAYPDFSDYQVSPEEYLRKLSELKDNLTIPVIASLNGKRLGQWTDFALRLHRAGADAIELNLYRVVTDSQVPADQIESEMIETVRQVAASVAIPVAVKLSPFHTALAQLVKSLRQAGASGVVLFNRFYQPDVNTETLVVQPTLRLSDPEEVLLRLRWLAILSPDFGGSLAASGGFHTADDSVKAFLTGAHAVQLVSVLLREGPETIAKFVAELRTWMASHDFTALDQFRGRLNLHNSRDPAAFERANYIRSLQSRRA